MTTLRMISVLFLAGCTTIRYEPYMPTCPVDPVLPIIMETELMDITEDTYRRLVERELRLREQIDLLKAYCEAP